MIFQNSLDAMVITSPDGQIHRANGEACRLLEMEEGEICRAGRAGVVDTSDPRLASALDERRRTGRWRGELILRRTDGTRFPAEVSSAVFRNWRGEERTIIVFRDVTERKRAEEVRARLAAIVEGSEDAVIGKLPDGTIRSWNAAAERLYGYSEEEAVGKSICMLFPPGREAEMRSLLEKVTRGEQVRHLETMRVRKDGQVVEVSLSISPIRDQAERVVGVSTIARDISERKRTEAERERLLGELQAALAQVKALRGLLPICANCKMIRDDKGRWNQIEIYIRDHSEATFTHGLCPECSRRLYPQLFAELKSEKAKREPGAGREPAGGD